MVYKRLLRLLSWAGGIIVFAARPPFVFGENFIFTNPIQSQDAVALIKSVVAQVQPFAITLTVFAIIFVGVQYVIAVASGNPGKTQQAKVLLFYVMIGATIVAGALVIANAVILFAQGLSS